MGTSRGGMRAGPVGGRAESEKGAAPSTGRPSGALGAAPALVLVPAHARRQLAPGVAQAVEFLHNHVGVGTVVIEGVGDEVVGILILIVKVIVAVLAVLHGVGPVVDGGEVGRGLLGVNVQRGKGGNQALA